MKILIFCFLILCPYSFASSTTSELNGIVQSIKGEKLVLWVNGKLYKVRKAEVESPGTLEVGQKALAMVPNSEMKDRLLKNTKP